MLLKVKRFSDRQKLLETEDGVPIEPVNQQYRYFRSPLGTCVDGIRSELDKKN